MEEWEKGGLGRALGAGNVLSPDLGAVKNDL